MTDTYKMPCEACYGEGVFTEFRLYAGEGMAGEEYQRRCEECNGTGEQDELLCAGCDAPVSDDRLCADCRAPDPDFLRDRMQDDAMERAA